MSQNQLHKSVYIPSIEGARILEYTYRNRELKLDYVGMVPSSLELEKLVETGLKVKENKRGKRTSIDMINVKFKRKVRDTDDTREEMEKELDNLEQSLLSKKVEYEDATDKEKDKLGKSIKWLEKKVHEKKECINNIPNNWKEKKNDQVRKLLYRYGFTIEYINKRSGKSKKVKYVFYKRSSAKSRVGNALFINEKLHKKMITWSNMGLDITKHEVDVPALLAYQSLVSSSIEDIIKINPENILLIDDYDSKFTVTANVVKKREGDEYLSSKEEEVEISNSIWDGQSLLDEQYFEGKDFSMMLLRNHMFKSAAFRCNVQKFLMDYAKEKGIDFDTWVLEDMLGNTKMAKDVYMITTPNSLKALKFSHVVGTKAEMYIYWKELVKNEGSLFGICKHEKSSKYDELQRLSYQMINSLPGVDLGDMEALAQLEKEFVKDLKNDDEKFIGYLGQTANEVNCHQMLIDVYKKNPDFAKTRLFNNFRISKVSEYVKSVRSGKVRVNGDYAVLLSCPMEMLRSAVGLDVDENNPTLKGNEVYNTRFNDGEDLVGFRNPHTSPSNILKIVCVHNEDIQTYLPNLTDNIVVINTIKFEILSILSGADMDSDAILLTNGLLTLAERAKQYKVCVNKVEAEKARYEYVNSDIAKIDNALYVSGKQIGQVVNFGQLCMSVYWHMLSKGAKSKKLQGTLDAVSTLTVLSEICIDQAKKKYDLDFEAELKHLKGALQLYPEKPLFWNVIKKKKKKNKIGKSTVKYKFHNCPMDWLQKITFDVKPNLTPVTLEVVLDNNIKANNANRHQIKKIFEKAKSIKSELIQAFSGFGVNDERDEEILNEVEDIIVECEHDIDSLKITIETIYSIMLRISNNLDEECKIAVRAMNLLYKTRKQLFMEVFAKNA